MRIFASILALALVLPFVSGSPIAADDKKSGTETAKKEKGNEAVPRKASVTDEFDVGLDIEAAAFYEAAGGFLPGGDGKKAKQLTLVQGAHEILIDCDTIVSLEVVIDEKKLASLNLKGLKKEEHVAVIVERKGGGTLAGGLDRELEIRGAVQFGESRIKLFRVKKIAFRG